MEQGTRFPRRIEEEQGRDQQQHGKETVGIRTSLGSLRRQLGSRFIHTQRKSVPGTNEVTRMTCSKWIGYCVFRDKDSFNPKHVQFKDGGGTR